MVNAIVLVNVKRSKVNEVAETLAGLPGISEVYSVAGRVDLAAMIRVKANEEVADLVTKQITNVDGVESTETLLAFRAYSRTDLDAICSAGF